jgi:ABC-type sugar transport system substrate-binding protein
MRETNGMPEGHGYPFSRTTGPAGSTRRKAPLRGVVAALAFAVIALALAACGSSSSTSSTSSSSSASSGTASAAASEATKQVLELETRPTAFTVPPLPAKPATGKTIDYIACGLPVCIAQQVYIREAAAAVGWKFKFLNAGLSPTSVDAAYEQAVNDDPAGVIGTGGFAPELFVHQLAKLKEKNVPVVVDDTEGSEPGLTEIVGSSSFQLEKGEEMGKWILADSKGTGAHVGIITTPETPVYAATHKGIEKFIGGSGCSSCSVTTYDFPEEDIGTKLPTLVVTFVRTHPEVNYLFFDFANELDGVPSALASAGLSSKVKLVATDSGNVENEYLKKGQESATAADPWPEAYWGMFDAILRADQGAPLSQNESIVYPRMIFTGTNVLATNSSAPAPLVADFQSVYKKAWHVG